LRWWASFYELLDKVKVQNSNLILLAQEKAIQLCRGIAFNAMKDCTKGTMAKLGQFLKSFQGMYFPIYLSYNH
jgi:hypothetical protein